MTLPTTDIDRALQVGSTFLGDLTRALSYHRWLIALAAAATLLSTYVSLQFVNDEYESTARLLVKLGRENAEVPATVEKGGVITTGVRKEEINSEIQLMTSRPLLTLVVDTLGAQAFKLEPPPPQTLFQKIKHELRSIVRWFKTQYKDALIALNLRKRLTDQEDAIVLLQRTVTVEREKDSDVISVAVRLPSAELAVQVGDTLVRLYLDKHVEVRRDKGLGGFYDERLKSLKGEMGTLDASKVKLRTNGNISAMNEERVLLLRRLQALYDDIANDSRELHLVQNGASPVPGPILPTLVPTAGPASAQAASVAALNSANAARLPPLNSYPNFDQLKNKVTELRIKRSELLHRFTDRTEPILQVEREMAQIEGTLRQGLSARVAEQRAVANSIEKRLQDLNVGETALDVIERDRAIAGQSYLAYAKRREDARIAEELDLRRVSNIAVLNMAERPIEPVAPKKLLIVALSLPFGLLIGLGLALFLEYLNKTVRDERDLAGLDGVAYLGSLTLPATSDKAKQA